MNPIPRKSTKPKKQKNSRYQFNINEIVLYCGGLYPNYLNQECKIVSRNKKHTQEYYKIEFEDGLIMETVVGVLKRKEVEEKIDQSNTTES